MRSLGLVLAGGVLAALLVAPSARATVVVQRSLGEMTQRADVVVHAVVEDSTVTSGEGDGRILTLTRLRVKDSPKGSAKAGDTYTLYQVGGTLGGRVARIPGMNDFKAGEEIVLFADRFIATDTVRFLQESRKADVPAQTLNPSAGFVVVFALGLGKYVVERQGSVPIAVEQVGDVAVAVPSATGMVVGGRPVVTRQPLDALLSEVRRAAGRAP